MELRFLALPQFIARACVILAVLLASCVALVSTAQAQEAYRVKDINTVIGLDPSCSVSQLFVWNGTRYAIENNKRRIQRINPVSRNLETALPFQSGWYQMNYLGEANGVILLTDGGNDVWRTDLTAAGTYRLRDFGSGEVQAVSALGTTFLRYWPQQSGPWALWRCDGTTAGLVQLTFPPANDESYMSGTIEEMNGKLYFTSADAAHGEELWVSDGTVGGTHLLIDLLAGPDASRITGLRRVGNKLFFFADAIGSGLPSLWTSDGTAGGTQPVPDIHRGSWLEEGATAAFGGLYYYGDVELWVSDGTTGGTHLVRDIDPTGWSYPGTLRVVGDALYFLADHADHGRELWRSDGTESGTSLVADVNPGPESSSADLMVALGDRLLWRAWSPTYGRELWVTDGTPSGTHVLKDIDPNDSGGPDSLSRLDDQLMFIADSPGHGYEPWVTDGTSSGTQLYNDWGLALSASFPSWLTSSGDHVYFYAWDGSRAVALWSTDGTASNTLAVASINYNMPLDGESLGVLNGKAFFAGTNPADDFELWTSGGTPASTNRFMDVLAGASSSSPGSFFTHHQHMYFNCTGSAPSFATQLWRTDGTVAGTHAVHPSPRIRSYDGHDFTGMDFDRVAYTSGLPNSMNDDGIIVWVTNGTQNTEIGTYRSFSGGLLWLGLTGTADGKLFYVGQPAVLGALPALWCSDGTPAGTHVPKDLTNQLGGLPIYGLAATDSLAIFMHGSSGTGADLWRSDGTENGTYAITPAGGKFVSTATGYGSLNPKAGVASVSVGAYLYFIANHPAGNGLWRTDGTAAGTVFLRAGVDNLIADDGAAYFTALDGNGPGQAWYRTTPLSMESERLGSIPATLAPVDSFNRPVVGASAIFFVATGSEQYDGQELWALPLLSGAEAATWTAYE